VNSKESATLFAEGGNTADVQKARSDNQNKDTDSDCDKEKLQNGSPKPSWWCSGN